MPTLLDEMQLETNFTRLRQHLKDTDGLNPARSDPIVYFIYPPAMALTVRRLLPGWIAQLRNQDGLEASTLSLSELLWEVIDASGRWPEWLELEADFDLKEINDAVRSVLIANNALVERVAQYVAEERDNAVVFITDIEMLHPFFRTRAIESYLHNKVRVPTVFLYPGLRVGQYDLKFLEFYSEDSGYRSPIIGGLD